MVADFELDLRIDLDELPVLGDDPPAASYRVEIRATHGQRFRVRQVQRLVLRIPRTSLNGELHKVEKAVGLHLLVPWRRPLRTTPKGQELIDEAHRLLELRDAQQRESDLNPRRQPLSKLNHAQFPAF
ncbi:hypothetical protein OG729_00785 [Streptomyces sp. NBC_00210]|uniref:hypothetical protein n=1 Tax=Streptomyces sp. NBC_00210 TaxID=2903636 RepID=UPI003245068E